MRLGPVSSSMTVCSLSSIPSADIPAPGQVIEHDLADGDEIDVELVLVNFSAEESTLWVFRTGEPRARDVRIRVLEDGGLDIERPRLDNGPELDPRRTGYR